MNDLELLDGNDLKKDEAPSNMDVSSSRAMMEVQAQVIMAKKFPRNQYESFQRIMKACERYSIADAAQYVYPKAGTTVSGPSIVIARVIAQNWGNLEYGIRELSQKKGESVVESFCWDLETNSRQSKSFVVQHSYKNKTGIKVLVDPRDIYEHVANQGTRRLRSCILGTIPPDIIEAVLKKCEETVRAGNGVPFQDRLRTLISALDSIGVCVADLEERMGHSVSTITPDEAVEFKKIFTSIKEGHTKRGDWFKSYKKDDIELSGLNDKFSNTGESNDDLKDSARKIIKDKKETTEKESVPPKFVLEKE